MNFSDVTATRHYVIRYPKSNRDTFRAQCYGGTKCSKGWYKANLANTWGLCKNEDKDNQRYFKFSYNIQYVRKKGTTYNSLLSR